MPHQSATPTNRYIHIFFVSGDGKKWNWLHSRYCGTWTTPVQEHVLGYSWNSAKKAGREPSNDHGVFQSSQHSGRLATSCPSFHTLGFHLASYHLSVWLLSIKHQISVYGRLLIYSAFCYTITFLRCQWHVRWTFIPGHDFSTEWSTSLKQAS